MCSRRRRSADRRPVGGIAACLPMLLALAACEAPAHERHWDRLRTGMGHDEVESLLGRPSTTYVPERAKVSDAGRPALGWERWQYGDTLSSMATRAVFPEEADERAWCVFFGPDGKVAGFRPPSWASDRRQVDPPLPGVPPPRPGSSTPSG